LKLYASCKLANLQNQKLINSQTHKLTETNARVAIAESGQFLASIAYNTITQKQLFIDDLVA
jgi:hypothetical protein